MRYCAGGVRIPARSLDAKLGFWPIPIGFESTLKTPWNFSVCGWRNFHIILLGRALSSGALGQFIDLPNGSFESPATSFVNTHVDAWQKTPKPDSYDESGGFLWDQLTGVFSNTPVGATDHIDNCDGAQAVYLFAVPEVGLLQDDGTKDWNDLEPSHAFNTNWMPGTAYQLAFGIIGGGGNMREGVTLEAALYFRDGTNRTMTVASTNVVFAREIFPNRTHLTEIQLRIPAIKVSDPWAGQPIGIRFTSTVSTELQGGYWDLDNVRLTAISPPKFTVTAQRIDTNFRLTWPSVNGYSYQVTRSDDLQTWPNLGPALPGSGAELAAFYPFAESDRFFFRVLAVPSF